MAREIKFRGIKKGGCDFLFFNLSNYVSKDDGNEPPLFLQYTLKPETLGQFTGLKDKNGIDIYEGDILRHPLATEPEHFGFTVNFKDFKWVCICVFENEIIVDFDTYFEQCEIIGNIYQNPELLNQ